MASVVLVLYIYSMTWCDGRKYIHWSGRNMVRAEGKVLKRENVWTACVVLCCVMLWVRNSPVWKRYSLLDEEKLHCGKQQHCTGWERKSNEWERNVREETVLKENRKKKNSVGDKLALKRRNCLWGKGVACQGSTLTEEEITERKGSRPQWKKSVLTEAHISLKEAEVVVVGWDKNYCTKWEKIDLCAG